MFRSSLVHFIFFLMIVLANSCALRTEITKKNGPKMSIEDDEINQNLRLGFKFSKWFYVPYNSSLKQYNTELAKECFMTDFGPDHFSEGLARFIENDKMGLINELGKVVVSAQYDYISQVENHLAVVCVGCQKKSSISNSQAIDVKWGVIDSNGKIVVPIAYREIDFDPWANKVSVRSDRSQIKKKNKKKGRRKKLPSKNILIKQESSISE